MRFAAIHREAGNFDVAWMCSLLGVSRSGFYKWRRGDLPKRARADARLHVQVKSIFRTHKGRYGAPRIQSELRGKGEKASRRRISRSMREQGLVARRKRAFRVTTDSRHDFPVAPNLLRRNFAAEAPNRVWVGDITAVRTRAGWLYLAVVIDLFSRRVVGWAADTHMRTELVLAALSQAVRLRRPERGLIFHSDRGVQYASREYRDYLGRHGIKQSMSRKGDCWDNAVAESFFSTLKTELLFEELPINPGVARIAIGEYIDGYYNPVRKHSSMGYASPIKWEALASQGGAEL
jgi:putative transposase